MLSNDGLKTTRAKIESLPQACTLYAEESVELPETRARVVRLPFARTARSVNRLSIGTVALAALLQDSGMFPTAAFGKSVSTFQKPDISDVNLRAIEAGIGLTTR